ncbi:MAG: hypothetical protein RMK29_21230 [Myxococcales bacterium]|nr:hypothetical protein [Myxococcota bacterium]MDW8284234.1 hypothetical protein [Myxococcales bacterium]
MTKGVVSQEGLDRPLVVPLWPAHAPPARPVPCSWGLFPLSTDSLPGLCALLAALFLLLLAVGTAGPALVVGLLLVGTSGAMLLRNDYRWSLRLERGRLYLLRNGVSVFDSSVLPEGQQCLLLTDGCVELLRRRPGEPPVPVFGVPPLRLSSADLVRVQERLAAEREALEHTSRQIELLDDPDVQARLLGRLRCEERDRPSALRPALLSLSQGKSPQARTAQALLGRHAAEQDLGLSERHNT